MDVLYKNNFFNKLIPPPNNPQIQMHSFKYPMNGN